jgi:hypothetical protein
VASLPLLIAPPHLLCLGHPPPLALPLAGLLRTGRLRSTSLHRLSPLQRALASLRSSLNGCFSACPPQTGHPLQHGARALACHHRCPLRTWSRVKGRARPQCRSRRLALAVWTRASAGSWPTPIIATMVTKKSQRMCSVKHRNPRRRAGRLSIATKSGSESSDNPLLPHPRPPGPCHQVPTHLIGHCFNCLRPDHIIVDCTFNPHCLRCHREGHHVHSCKCPHSTDIAGPPPHQQKLPPIAMINKKLGDVVLATPTHRHEASCLGCCSSEGVASPLGHSAGSMPEGSLSHHTLPSPPPPPLPKKGGETLRVATSLSFKSSPTHRQSMMQSNSSLPPWLPQWLAPIRR